MKDVKMMTNVKSLRVNEWMHNHVLVSDRLSRNKGTYNRSYTWNSRVRLRCRIKRDLDVL